MSEHHDLGRTGSSEEQPHRLISGIPRLDYILKGGFICNGLYALFGPPGSGKTILANQLCFNQIKERGSRCVYLTLLTESHGKLVSHLSSLSFFDLKHVGKELIYLSAYQHLRDNGVEGMLQLIQETARAEEPDILIIDGFESLADLSSSVSERREFIHRLQTLVSMNRCTTLLLSTATAAETRSVEEVMVDGALQLTDTIMGPRAVRELNVLKFRGSDYLRGKHEVEITSDGIQIHPRTEVQFSDPARQATETRSRMEFGVPELDEMLCGGIPSGSSMALLGPPGAGKTALGLSFLCRGAELGQRGMYFGFHESPPRLIEKAESIGLPLKKYVDQGLIEIVWQPPLERFLDSLAEQMLEELRHKFGDRPRLFVDSLEGFRAAVVYRDRLPLFIAALMNQLRTIDVTSLFAEELSLFGGGMEVAPASRELTDGPYSDLGRTVESALWLRYVALRSQFYRLISVMKMRESSYDTAAREFHISSRGVEVDSSYESAEAILSGYAVPRRDGNHHAQSRSNGRSGGGE
ncbi:AAA family ATPase [Proteobacteria bacterium 005FR1]|nr:AAA family ATPase [Proteobacteria bacterium 005FR1]